jgi:hypothetical protein
MVRFEKFLNASKELEWEGYYIAYGDLKSVLKDSEYKQRLQAKMRASGDFNKMLGQSQHGNEDIWMLETSGQSLSAAALEDSFSKVMRANRIFSPMPWPLYVLLSSHPTALPLLINRQSDQRRCLGQRPSMSFPPSTPPLRLLKSIICFPHT